VSNAAGSATSASEMLIATAALTAPNKIASPLSVAAQAGAPFQYALISSGGTAPLRFSAATLPPGLSLHPDTGVISGAPAEIGETKTELTSANAAGQVSVTLTLTVTENAPELSYSAWRRRVFGAAANDPLIAGESADPDGDGAANLEEFLSGTDPLDPFGVPAAPLPQ
jgi:hypothetical protein